MFLKSKLLQSCVIKTRLAYKLLYVFHEGSKDCVHPIEIKKFLLHYGYEVNC